MDIKREAEKKAALALKYKTERDKQRAEHEKKK